MKHALRLACLSLVLVLAVATSYSQNAYMKGNSVAHIGVGFGLAGVYGDASLPPITAGFEYGFEDKISLGGIVGYAGSSQTFFGGEWKYTYILIGARGGYHFLENNDKWDAYAGLLLGYNIVSVSTTGTVGGFGFSAGAGASYMLFGVYGGGRYYVSPNFAIFGELGYGAGFVTLGVALKL